MGTWGSGVFENDHALDLHFTEVKRLIQEVEHVLSLEPVAFDDHEGPLFYIHLLGLLAKAHEVQGLDRNQVEKWKGKYIKIFTSTIGPGHEDYLKSRQAVIQREFDTLIALLPLEDACAKSAPSARRRNSAGGHPQRKRLMPR